MLKRLMPITTVDELYKRVDAIDDAIIRFYVELDESERESALICDFSLHVCNISPENVIRHLKKEPRDFTHVIDLCTQHFSKGIQLNLPNYANRRR